MTIINRVYKVNVYIHFHYSLLRHKGLFGQFLQAKKLITAEDMCIFLQIERLDIILRMKYLMICLMKHNLCIGNMIVTKLNNIDLKPGSARCNLIIFVSSGIKSQMYRKNLEIIGI